MKKGNLLIVDDEIYIVDNLCILLRSYADKIFPAYNGIEALKVLETEEVHCIVCDINMPKMNGVQLIKEVRKRNIETPFIFYTGHGNVELMREAAKYGAFDFLDKPNFDGLYNVVTLGLQKGFERSKHQSDWDKIESEYIKMLKEI